MEFKEFMDKVVEALKQYYGTSAEVTMQTVIKTNDTVQHGVVIRATGKVTAVAPILYLDHYYEKLMDGSLCFEDVLSELEEDWKNAGGSINPDQVIECVTDWEAARKRVFPILLSSNRNQAMLEELVTTDFLDLKVAYQLRLDMGGCGETVGTTKIKEDMLERYDITVDELHEQAMENLKNDGFGYFRMEDILFNMLGDEDGIQPVEKLEDDGMYCLCNKSRQYGAGGLLDMDFLMRTADGKNCFIIPSSIHEILVIPDKGMMEQKVVDEMVQNVNENEVSPDEVLSDHAYYFNAETGEIQLSK